MNLLSNKESECRTGGLNILGSLCGLGYNYETINVELKTLTSFFRRYKDKIPLAIWEIIY